MKRKISFVFLLVVLAAIFIVGFFILNVVFFGPEPEKESKIFSPVDLHLANGTLRKKDVVWEFRLALAAALDEIIENERVELKKSANGELVDFQIRVQKIEVAKKQYLVVYLIKEGGRKKQLIWGDSIDRLKKPGNIKKCAQEVALVIIYEVSDFGFKKQLGTKKSKKILVLVRRGTVIAPLFYR